MKADHPALRFSLSILILFLTYFTVFVSFRFWGLGGLLVIGFLGVVASDRIGTGG
jgi:hypothetical protein